MSDKPAILFANYAVPNCGVHQFGRNLRSVLGLSSRFRFDYADIRNLEDLDRAVERERYRALFVNYHPQTMPFIDVDMPVRYPIACVAVMHEMTQAEADRMPRGFFQFYVMADPTLQEINPCVFSTGRIIPAYDNRKPLPDVPTFGSFGFSVASKGFGRLVDVVQREYDEAVIRINIPPNGIIDRDAREAKRQVDLCRTRLWKPGIRLVASHEFFDDAGLIDFLASNTLNAFLYDYVSQAGISSATDHAMTARRPIAITKSVMFRHLHRLEPRITIEDTSLEEIIRNGIRPFEHLLQAWAPERICLRYEEIVTKVLSYDAPTVIGGQSVVKRALRAKFLRIGKGMITLRQRISHAIRVRANRYLGQPLVFAIRSAPMRLLMLIGVRKPQGGFNRILDDSARVEHAGTIRRLASLAPEIIAKKIPRANIQQAFVFDTVEKFAREFSKPRMLCVGSFEDSAAVALKKVGYPVEEIDPAVNKLDLDRFYHLPTTRRESYHIIFSTSVLEHVKDDEKFVRQIADLLVPGGVGILTCDFKEGYKPGDPVIDSDYRFYTRADLLNRVLGKLQDCELVDAPRWDCPSPDFELGGFKYTFATLVFRRKETRDFPVDWDRLTPAEQARFYNENGFLVVPQALNRDEVERAIEEIGRYGLKGTTEEIWSAPFTRRLVTNDKLLSALRAIFGPDLRFFKGAYVETPPTATGSVYQQRKLLHLDYGIGEAQGDVRNSSASWVNVGFYLTDLTPECAPLWIVPGSNRLYSIAPDSYLEHLEDQAKMVLARAGDAVLFHCNTVHAASYNFSNETRHALFYSYRPAWAKPVGPVPEWPEAFIQSFPSEHRALLSNLNAGIATK